MPTKGKGIPSSVVMLTGRVVNQHQLSDYYLSVHIQIKTPKGKEVVNCLSTMAKVESVLLALRKGNVVSIKGYLTSYRRRYAIDKIPVVAIEEVKVLKVATLKADAIEELDNLNPESIIGETNKKGELKT